MYPKFYLKKIELKNNVRVTVWGGGGSDSNLICISTLVSQASRLSLSNVCLVNTQWVGQYLEL